ncbi:MAG TPA: MarR family transcriptional regulator [Longimicrobiales bacterium]|nr:MarR family transcriptional regulator [Longimicrobiales bacterium]
MRKHMDVLTADQQRSFGHTLLECARLFDQLGQERLNADLGEDIARPSVMRLIPHMPAEGIRPTELARRADISKQAVGQTLAYLEERGLVEFAPDPADGRALIVRMTDVGAEASRLGLKALGKVEREVAKRVGSDVIAATFAGLREILAALESREV